MSLVLERRASKEEILELYLNDVYLGQRGSFAIHGVAEAARIFFGKDVANISVSEAALIAGVIQSPASRSPFANPKRAVERRNVVLRAMADEGFITASRGRPRRCASRCRSPPARVDNEAPYFVDMVSQQVAEVVRRRRRRRANRVDVYTTLDLNLQRAALDAVRIGPREGGRGSWRAGAARRRPGRRRRWSPSIRAPARSWRWSAAAPTTSRSSTAPPRRRRQPGSVFKPFVYLAAFEHAARDGRARPDAGVADARRAGARSTSTASCGSRATTTTTTARSPGGARWRCRATSAPIRVGERIGFNTVARSGGASASASRRAASRRSRSASSS